MLNSLSRNNSAVLVDEFPYAACLTGRHAGMIISHFSLLLCSILSIPILSRFLWLSLRGGLNISPKDVLPINLNLSELLFCFQPFTVVMLVLNPQNIVAQQVLFFFNGIPWVSRSFIQICICIERYVAVLYPITFLRCKHPSYRCVPAAMAWLVSLGYGWWVSNSLASFPDFMFLTIACVVIIVITFCCVSVLWTLKQPGPGAKEVRRHVLKKKAFRAIARELLHVLSSYMPLVLLYVLNQSTIDQTLLVCDLTPPLFCPNMYSVLIHQLLKLHKEVKSKCRQPK